MIYLPDTNAFSRYFPGQDLGLKLRLENRLSSSRLSAIVVYEIEYGAAKRPDFPAYAERVHRLRTINLAEFSRVPRLGVVNWQSAP